MPAVVVDGSFAAVMWCIRAIQGRLGELGPVVRAWRRSVGEQPVWSHVTEAQLLCQVEDLDGARAAFERAVRKGLLELPRGFAWTSTITWAADVCAALGDRPRAARLHDVLAPFAGVIVGESGPVDRAVGRLALTLGDRAGAERHLRNAVALCERMDARAYWPSRASSSASSCSRRTRVTASRAGANRRRGARYAGHGSLPHSLVSGVGRGGFRPRRGRLRPASTVAA